MTARNKWDETRAIIEAGQDADILAPGLILFPNGGRVNVHTVRDGQVYYALRDPGGDEWALVRKTIPLFLAGVKAAGGCHVAKEPPPDSHGPMSEIDWDDIKRADAAMERQIYGDAGTFMRGGEPG